MTSLGRLRIWQDDEGWGVIDSPDTPGGCWVHISALLIAGSRTLRTGQELRFTWEAADQDGYAFRAEDAWPADEERVDRRIHVTGPSAAFSSRLTLTFDDDDEEA